MQKRISFLENKVREKNIIIYGLDEKENENADAIKETVIKNIKKTFDIDLNNDDVDSINRLGRRQNHSQGGATGDVNKEVKVKTRPVLCSFANRDLKSKVLQAAKETFKNKATRDNLNGIKYNEDYSETVRSNRAKLIPHMIEFRNVNNEDNFKCFLKFDKLIAGDEVYCVDPMNDNEILLID